MGLISHLVLAHENLAKTPTDEPSAYKKSEQEKKNWRLWHFKVQIEWRDESGLPEDHIQCMGCGKITGLDLEFFSPSRTPGNVPSEPQDAQVVCSECSEINQDFRSPAYREFQFRKGLQDSVQGSPGRYRLRQDLVSGRKAPEPNDKKVA